MGKKEKILFFGIIIVVLGVLLFHFPVSYEKSVTAYTVDGEMAQVDLDVILRRKLWKQDELWGKIYFNGEEYTSLKDIYGDNYSGSMNFALGDEVGISFTRGVIRFVPQDGMETFYLELYQNDDVKLYYAPATSVEEARAMYEEVHGVPFQESSLFNE